MDEVRDSPERPTYAVTPIFRRVVLPLVGEGGPLAVDEVIPFNRNGFGQNDHRYIDKVSDSPE